MKTPENVWKTFENVWRTSENVWLTTLWKKCLPFLQFAFEALSGFCPSMFKQIQNPKPEKEKLFKASSYVVNIERQNSLNCSRPWIKKREDLFTQVSGFSTSRPHSLANFSYGDARCAAVVWVRRCSVFRHKVHSISRHTKHLSVHRCPCVLDSLCVGFLVFLC